MSHSSFAAAPAAAPASHTTDSANVPDSSDPSAEPAAARPRGRPGRRTPELTAKICDAIEQFGHTLTHAGLLAGVPRSTTARWKDEDEDFGDEVETARARFLQERMLNALSKTHPDGQKDWRAQKWAHEQGMKHSLDAPPPLPRGRRPAAALEKPAEPAPVRYGPKPGDGGRCLYDGHGEPVEWTRPPGVPLDDDRYLPDGSLIMTEEILSQMQDMRERELKAYWEEGPDGPTGQRWDAALAEALAQNAPPYDTDHDQDNAPKSSENTAEVGAGTATGEKEATASTGEMSPIPPLSPKKPSSPASPSACNTQKSSENPPPDPETLRQRAAELRARELKNPQMCPEIPKIPGGLNENPAYPSRNDRYSPFHRRAEGVPTLIL